jgi:RNA polymerase sigma factor (sigma-70 family)
MDDRRVAAVPAAGGPAAIAAAYDRYAASLYGYCHWMLRQPADAGEALRDTFVVAAAVPGGLPDAPQLRPWLYSVARRECLRRLPAGPAADDWEAEPERQGQPDAAAGEVSDATMPMRVVALADALTAQPTDMTMPLRAISFAGAVSYQPFDATMPMRAIDFTDVPAYRPFDATMTMPVRVAEGRAALDRNPGPAELQTLMRAILTDLRPREREVTELQLRHDLDEADVARVLGVPPRRARALAARARGRLEKALGELLVARTGRAACPELDALLAEWDGRPTEQARDLIAGHVEQCQGCTARRPGGLRQVALSNLMPLVPPPAELREQVLRLCSAGTPDAVAFRRRVIRRAKAVWLARVWRAVRLMRWTSIRTRPGVAIATTAAAMWVATAITVTTLVFIDVHSAGALTVRPSVRPPSSSPVAIAPAASAPVRAFRSRAARPSVSPSPAHRRPQAVVLPPVESPSDRPSPSPKPSRSPSRSRSPRPSRSPKPSKSASPKPSASPSPTASPSAS